MTDLAETTAPVPGATARLSVEHVTRYEYATPVEMAHHVACLRPLSDALQSLHVFEMSVSPQPSHHSTCVDAFGNSRAYFSLSVPHSELVVTARSQVEVRAPSARPDPAASLPCALVRERLAYRAQAPFEPAAEFTCPSPHVPLLEALRDYGAVSLRPGRPLAEAAIDLMQRIHRDFDYKPLSTDISMPLLDVFERRQGVCQDFAHLMLGALRACGLAARYVSGYLLTQPPPGQPRLVGADASHAWVSVWCPGLGRETGDGASEGSGSWLALDPTNNCVPGQAHVRVAHGRDFGDVTPLRGVIRGGGHHTLSVQVTTLPQGEAPGVSPVKST